MPHLFQLLGFAGVALASIAYLPQILHLAKEHCSAGVSVRAWSIWFVAALLIGSHAASEGDTVFIALQVVNAGASGAIAVLGRRYRDSRCAAHRHWTAGGECGAPAGSAGH